MDAKETQEHILRGVKQLSGTFRYISQKPQRNGEFGAYNPLYFKKFKARKKF